jgi:hypothetical protein
VALTVYARQALNLEAEQKAAGVRLRAERRAGELLRESSRAGTRQKPGGDRRSKSTDMILKSPSLSDLNISLNQSSNWQKLAAIPQKKNSTPSFPILRKSGRLKA